MVFLGAALILGGAGDEYPLIRLCLEVLAILAFWATTHAGSTLPRSALGRLFMGLLAAWAALIAAQLQPLPPWLWQSLPGRQAATALLKASQDNGWHSLSLTPDLGALSLQALIVPAVAFIVTSAMPRHDRQSVLRLLVTIGVLDAILGIMQSAAGTDAPLYPFASDHRGVGIGLFVDRNHQAAFLLVAMACAFIKGVIRDYQTARVPMRLGRDILSAGIFGVLAIGVIATASRTGIAMLPLALIGFATLASRKSPHRRFIIGASCIFAVLAFVFYFSPLGQDVLARFSVAASDDRRLYWANTVYALRNFLPLGAGFGSFAHVYIGVEPLAQVQLQWINHAHNDYLELVLEGGWPAAVLAIAALVGIAVGVVNLWRRGEHNSALATAFGIGVILVFSLVEYPLRMTGTAVAMAILVAMLLPGGVARAADDGAALKPARRILVSAAAAAGVVIVVTTQVSISLLMARHAEEAVAVTPWLSAAWRSAALDELAMGKLDLAAGDARRALAISPTDTIAARVLAMWDFAHNRQDKGAALMLAASTLGWREPFVELWMVQTAMVAGRDDIAVDHIDALLRQRLAGDAMLQELRVLFRKPSGQLAVIAALKDHPGWRQGLFNVLAGDAVSEPAAIDHFLNELRTAGIGASPDETELMRWSLADRGGYLQAARIWTESGGTRLLADIGAGGDGRPMREFGPPFVWRAPALPGVTITPEKADEIPEVPVLWISSDGFAQGAALVQTIALPPGHLLLKIVLAPGGEAAAGLTEWNITCRALGANAGPTAIQLRWTRQTDGRMVGLGMVPDIGHCNGEDLALFVTGNSGKPFAFALQHVAIDKAP
ncbi:MAG: O-antigen ligase family protein [Pseudomonadota bacterium]|nr:O-antigen ligase family protein [Pseudomonadota bacterium]